MKTESENNSGDQTWGRTNNEAYVWEKEGQQEHHNHPEKGSKGLIRTDNSIQEDVSKLLTSDNFVDDSSILVEVNKGDVKLSGNVSEQNDKQRAEDLARAVPGVVNVENQIWVGPEDSKPSSEHHYKGLIHNQSSNPKSIF